MKGKKFRKKIEKETAYFEPSDELMVLRMIKKGYEAGKKEGEKVEAQRWAGL